MEITTKTRLIIVICLSILLIGMMVYEVYRTETMKITYKEVCLNDTNRICSCGQRGLLSFNYQTDK